MDARLQRTGWTFNESSAGMDCGTTTARYKADASGSATVTATRQSCGEARSCPGAEGLYQVTVVVGA